MGPLCGGFFADLGFFFLDIFALIEESVVVPPGLRFRGGDDGGVVRKAVFCE